MSLNRTKIIAAVCTVLVVSGVTIAVRVNRSSSPAAAKTAAAPAAAKPSTTRNGAAPAVANLSLEDWQHKIAEADLKDFRSLMNAALQISDLQLRDAVIIGIVDRWMLEDSENFIKYIASLEVTGAGPALSAVMNALQDSLTRLDPDRAASDEILVIVQRLINYLATTDPDKALVWAKQWLLEDTLENALVAIARSMARTDIEKSLAVIEQMTSPLRRSQALAAVGAIWAAKDPAAALKWAMGLKYTADRALTLNSVLLAVAQTNLSGAAASLQAQAQQIADEYTTGRNAEMAAAGKTDADYANDPESYKTGRADGTIPPPSSPDLELLADSATLIARLTAEGNVAAALAMIDGLPEGDFLKFKAREGLLEGWVKTDPAAAYAYVSANYPDNMDLVRPLYASWADSDWRAAANGTSLITDPVKRGLAMEEVIKSASVRNAAEMADYVSALPATESTDGVKAAMASAISYQSPEKAWDIAKGISNENAQYRALKSAFANLVIQNPSQAGNLLNTSTFSAATSDRLKEMLDAVVGN